jgi:hypothetical protein
LAAIVWILFRTGVRPFVALDVEVFWGSVWPYEPPDGPEPGYTWGSPSGFALYQLLRFAGATGRNAYLLEQVFVICLGILVLLLFLRRELDRASAWTATRWLILGSLGAVLIHWLGIYDSFTFFFWALFLLAWSHQAKIPILITSLLLGFQHFNQALIGLIAFFATLLILDRSKYPDGKRLLAISLAGVFLGKALQLALYWKVETSIASASFSRELMHLSLNRLQGELLATFSQFPAILWSLFAGLWVLVFLMLQKLQNRQRLQILFIFLGIFSVSAIAGDKTRVFVMISIPMMTLLVITFLKSRPSLETRWLIEATVWITYPLIVFYNSLLPTGWGESLLEPLLSLNMGIP